MLRVYDTGTITCTTTTDNQVTDHIKGKILKVEITASASSDFRIWNDVSDARGEGCVDEYIVGSSGSALTVNTTVVMYPVIAQVTAANVTTDPDQYSPFVIDTRLQIDASNVANADTYRVVIYYDDMTGGAFT